MDRPAPLLLAARYPADEPKLKIPSQVSKYDLATPDDLLFSYLLNPLFEPTDATKWGIWQELPSQVGSWVEKVLNASKVADIIASAMPIEGNRLTKVELMVKDACSVLHIEQVPTTYVRNSHEQRVYSFKINGETFLVITSGCLSCTTRGRTN